MLRRLFKDFHPSLVFAVVGLAAIGMFFIYSASFHDPGHYEVKQIFWIAIGLMIMITVAYTGYRPFLSMAYLFYGFSIALLILVHLIGSTHLGAQRWLRFGPVVIQPSEFAKLGTLLALVNYLGTRNPLQGQFSVILGAVAIVAVPLVLIIKQPDLGTALLFIPMLAVVFFLWGIQWRFLIISALGVLAAMPFVWEMLKDYQKKRILVFLNPNLDPLGSGYTAVQSKIAVGSGELFGKGYLSGTQTQLHFVPEHHTDFIFCVIGEELGFIGSLLVLCLYAYLFHSIFAIMEHTTDIRAKLLSGGVLALFLGHVLINIGMTIGLMPIAGVPLPLISYGGSSFVMNSIALGLVLSVYKERSIF
ncbi:MAG: Rod shape-determining protein RodA [Candidatus Omnitrophica bacterium ADurb.Bin277]|nr:MAG: Rod shape-determining protein RodA [Candidatus Omnitrophica bacterium ADurb.Bin277]